MERYLPNVEGITSFIQDVESSSKPDACIPMQLTYHSGKLNIFYLIMIIEEKK